MILTIVLGVALDDTVHILSSFYNQQKIHNHDSKKALSLTLNSVGSGVLKTSILLSLGFSALFFSDFATNQNSGVYLVIGMITAVLADLLLLPNIILSLFTKRDKSHLN
jgi:predicted RND superfamily exporter protein